MSTVEQMSDVANYLAKIQRLDAQGQARLPLPNVEIMPRQLVDVAERIPEITGTWNPVEIFTPDNMRAEKTTFLQAVTSGQVYNPQFNYRYAHNFQLGTSQQELEALLSQTRQFVPLNQQERIARIVLAFKLKDDIATYNLVQGIQNGNEAQIKHALQSKYPPLRKNPALWQLAQENFVQRVAPSTREKQSVKGTLTNDEQQYLKEREFNAEEIKQAFTWALEQYAMIRIQENTMDFAVVIEENVTNIDVRDKSSQGSTVFIPKDKKVNGITLLQLIGHEIEGHARQSVNGQKLFLLGGGQLKVDNEMLYEGLGKRYDDRVNKQLLGTDAGVPLPYYTYAIHAAEQGMSFYDIFQHQVTLRLQEALKKTNADDLPAYTELDEKQLIKVRNSAWLTTYRVMRGHVDTTNPLHFAMAKDLAYLGGYAIDKQLAEQGIGFLNESAIIQSGGLQLLAEYTMTEEDLPLKYMDASTRYWEEVLKPQMQKQE